MKNETPAFLTKSIRDKLLANGRTSKERANEDKDFNPYPVVKLFTPDAGATWLLSEIDPDNPDVAFGLCDLGLGFPELGMVSIRELIDLRGKLGLPIECDRYFKASMTLGKYAEIASSKGFVAA